MHKTIRRPTGSLGFPAALLALAAACASVVPAPLTVDEKIGQLVVIASTARFMNEAHVTYEDAYWNPRPNTLGNGYSLIVPYIVMLVVLLVRPYGLFGTPEIRRV